MVVVGLVDGITGFGLTSWSPFCKAFEAVRESDTSGKARERLRVSSFCFLLPPLLSVSHSSSMDLFEEFSLDSLKLKKSLSTHFSSGSCFWFPTATFLRRQSWSKYCRALNAVTSSRDDLNLNSS
ncbi:hypothetical protein V8G54_017609 [Vigna mungo]|uniref:Uncharacterized protein n=1 Tax=Vigna mungo TaxID=3915 RepID=A0AAQ3NMG7_VIGMU